MNLVGWVCVAWVSVCSAGAWAEAKSSLMFGRQFGTPAEEECFNSVADADGNIYVAGSTAGDLAGKNQGNMDGFLRKYDANGSLLWTRQFGSALEDRVKWVALDTEGHPVLTGFSAGALAGEAAGGNDVFVMKFDSAGTVLWKQQYGTAVDDSGEGICTDTQNHIYVTGTTAGKLWGEEQGQTDAFLMKLDPQGKTLYAVQFGTRRKDMASAVAVDGAMNAYVCGTTRGKLGEKKLGKKPDAFVATFNPQGERIRTLQFGTPQHEVATDLVVDAEGQVFVACSSGGTMAGESQGKGDAVLVKIGKSGEVEWSRQFGTALWDGFNGVALNDAASDHIVVTGCGNYPECQSICQVYDKDGTLLLNKKYTVQGEYGGTCGKGVCLTDRGEVCHAGVIGGELFGTPQGENDAFLLKLKLDAALVR